MRDPRRDYRLALGAVIAAWAIPVLAWHAAAWVADVASFYAGHGLSGAVLVLAESAGVLP
jgi:hypothetical protein